jgi:phage tail protein X
MGKWPVLPVVVLLGAAACTSQPVRPGTLLLSNPHFGPTNVEAVITANSDCASRGPGYVSTLEFVLPDNATKFIDVPPGNDICWRRDRDPSQPVAGQWSGWDRAFVAPGTTIDANL